MATRLWAENSTNWELQSFLLCNSSTFLKNKLTPLKNFRTESKMVKKSLDLELKFWPSYPIIAGVDEAGRGALAGPIVVAAVILPAGFQNPLIQDSKILSPSQRKRVYRMIKKQVVEYKIVVKSVREVEVKNPLGATKEAMVEAILNLKSRPNLCLIDGKEKIVVEGTRAVSVVGGDRRSINIAAASIIAKVTRDTIMQKLHQKYPLYDWFGNKGYPNKTHLTAIFQHGICDLHRKTYEPIKSLLKPDCDKKKLFERYNL